MRTRSVANKLSNNTIMLKSVNNYTAKKKKIITPLVVEEKMLGKKRNKENNNSLNNNSKKYFTNKENLSTQNLIVSKRGKKSNSTEFLVDLHDVPINSSHPKMVSEVFNEGFVDSLMYWRHESPPGSGLKNLGNTCFLNSVLQCILYTVPLKNYLDLSEHSQMCKIKGVCFICEFEKLSKLVGNIKIFK
jgi:hypothetical protein